MPINTSACKDAHIWKTIWDLDAKIWQWEMFNTQIMKLYVVEVWRIYIYPSSWYFEVLVFIESS